MTDSADRTIRNGDNLDMLRGLNSAPMPYRHNKQVLFAQRETRYRPRRSQ